MVGGGGAVGGGPSVLLVLQRHQYTLDRPFSYAYFKPWVVAGATTAILPFLAAPLEDSIKEQSEICPEKSPKMANVKQSARSRKFKSILL